RALVRRAVRADPRQRLAVVAAGPRRASRRAVRVRRRRPPERRRFPTRMKPTREHKIAIATAALAPGVPARAAWRVGARTQDLADRIGTRGEVEARIGRVDADLTGTIRLSDVALGPLFAADSVEASVALDSLLAGQFSADEIRVASPRIALDI